jgi:hypothetical protein
MKKQEVEELIRVVSTYYGVDCMEKNRRREYVDARMVAYKILREWGYTVMRIAEMFSKNHGTVVCALKNFHIFSTYDPSLVSAYNAVTDILNSEAHKYPAYHMEREELVKLVLNLEHDKKILNLQVSELNAEIRKYRTEYLPFITLLENKKFIDESHKQLVENKFEILLENV